MPRGCSLLPDILSYTHRVGTPYDHFVFRTYKESHTMIARNCNESKDGDNSRITPGNSMIWVPLVWPADSTNVERGHQWRVREDCPMLLNEIWIITQRQSSWCKLAIGTNLKADDTSVYLSVVERKSSWGPFLESPETFRANFGWHNSLCIFKTKASRSTKLCSYFK